MSRIRPRSSTSTSTAIRVPRAPMAIWVPTRSGHNGIREDGRDDLGRSPLRCHARVMRPGWPWRGVARRTRGPHRWPAAGSEPGAPAAAGRAGARRADRAAHVGPCPARRPPHAIGDHGSQARSRDGDDRGRRRPQVAEEGRVCQGREATRRDHRPRARQPRDAGQQSRGEPEGVDGRARGARGMPGSAPRRPGEPAPRLILPRRAWCTVRG